MTDNFYEPWCSQLLIVRKRKHPAILLLLPASVFFAVFVVTTSSWSRDSYEAVKKKCFDTVEKSPHPTLKRVIFLISGFILVISVLRLMETGSVFGRLLSLSLGQTSLSRDVWLRSKHIETLRRSRMEQHKSVNGNEPWSQPLPFCFDMFVIKTFFRCPSS